MFVARAQVRADLDRIQERRERAFRIDRGDHRARRDLGAVGEAPVARWRSTEISATWDEVRISAPNPRAASASASASAGAAPDDRRLPRRPAVVAGRVREQHRRRAADHGPIAVYWTARDAIAPRSASLSNVSAT